MSEVSKLAQIVNGLNENLNTSTIDLDLNSVWVGGTSGTGAAQLTKALVQLLAAATNLNTASTLVQRDPSGNFSAGTITASLTGHASADLLKSNNLSDVASAATAFQNIAPLTTAGDLLFENATPAPARLPIGTNGQILTVVSGLPAWSNASPTGVTSVTFTGDGVVLSSTPSSAVTSSGTLTATLLTQSANTFLAGPSTGSAAAPTFRSIVAADVPTLNQNTTGTAANITATSNSTLTTLSSLSLPYSQLTGAPSLSGYATTTLNNLGLTGYLYSNGAGSATASSTIPISALGTMAAYSILGNETNSSAAPTAISSGIQLGAPSITDTGIGIQQTNSVSGYFQSLIQNTSSNSAASTDFIVSNNLGTATTYYGDFGMNSSAFTGTGSLNLANAVYLYSDAVDLVLGTSTANAIHFVANNGATDAMTISSTGGIIMPALTGFMYANGSGAITAATTISPSAITGFSSTSQNYVYAGPTSGSGAPSFRALVAGDIPSLAYLPTGGGTMSGNIAMGSNKITGLANGSSANDAVNYGQLSAIIGGLNYDPNGPVEVPDMINDALTTPPGSPVNAASYLAAAGASGGWTAGHVYEWNSTTSTWVDVLGRAIIVGDRFGINFEALASTPAGSFAGKANYIATVTNATPGSYTYTFTTPTTNLAVYINGLNAQDLSHLYYYSGSVWVDLLGSATVRPNAGNGIAYSGNVLNVQYDNSTIGLTSNQLYVLSGGIGTTQLAAASVTLAKMANLAANSIMGNNTGSAATPIALTATQVTAMLNQFSTASTTQGLVPGSNGVGTAYFLRADGTWATPAGTGVTAVSVASSNGFSGTSSGGSTPSLTLSTSVTSGSMIKASSGALAAAVAGTDYVIPSGSITGSAASLSATLVVGSGGTGKTSVTTAPAATSWAGWDANSNLSANNMLDGYATTATAAGTTTLTVASAAQQTFTGTTTQTVVMPVATTLVNGMSWTIVNLSTGVVTVETSGTNVIQAMAANTQLTVTVINTAGGTGTASWNWVYVPVQSSALSGTVTSVGAIGSTPNANAASISGNTLTLQPANASFGGVVTTAAQTFAGAKTLSSALTISASSAQLVLGTNLTISSPTQSSAYTLTLPNITANDTVSTLGLAQTYSAARTFSLGVTISATSNQLVLGTTNTLTLTSTQASSQTLTIPAIAAADTIATLGTTQTFGGAKTFTTAPTFSTALAITSGGTGLTSTSQNFVFAGPTSGSGAPTWRLLVAGDVPTLNQNTTGTAASVTGTNVVTNTNLAQMATLTLKGNNTGSTANAADLTVAQVNTMLGTATLSATQTFSGTNTFSSQVIISASSGQLKLGTNLTISSPTQTTAYTLTVPNITANDTIATLAQTQTLTNKSIAAGSNTITGLTNSNLSGTAGITGANIASNTVTATNLATSAVDGVTLTGGNGTALSVLESPSVVRTLIAGQTFAANTSYCVRWGMPSNGETQGRVYVADITTSSYNLFYVIGMVSGGASGVTAGNNIAVTTLGSFTLSSSDAAFATNTGGTPVFLTANGTFSVTAPSTAGQALVRVGVVQVQSATATSNIIDVNPHVLGIN